MFGYGIASRSASNGRTCETVLTRELDPRQTLRVIDVASETLDRAYRRRTFPAIVGTFKTAQFLNARHGLSAIVIAAELGDALRPAMSNAKPIPAQLTHSYGRA